MAKFFGCNNNGSIKDILNNLDKQCIKKLSIKNEYGFGEYYKSCVCLSREYFDVLDKLKDLESGNKESVLVAKNNIAGWLLHLYKWKKDSSGRNKFRKAWFRNNWTNEVEKDLNVFDLVFNYLKNNVSIKDELSAFNTIKGIL